MTSQQQASELLATWQQRRSLPPTLRLIDCPPPADDYDATLDAVRLAMYDV